MIRIAAVSMAGALALAGCAQVQEAISVATAPSTIAAIQAVEAGGKAFICAAASAQAATTAQEKANGVTGSIVTDGNLFYFGSSLACSALGGSVSTVAMSSKLGSRRVYRRVR